MRVKRGRNILKKSIKNSVIKKSIQTVQNLSISLTVTHAFFYERALLHLFLTHTKAKNNTSSQDFSPSNAPRFRTFNSL